ncbi:MAG: ABC-F family ATP-binding cassette domain-containing protein [Roseivirga sp.]
MIVIHDLTYHIGARSLYAAANLHIKPKEKIGLVGLNGTGKSTLLKLIAGELTPDQGTISASKDCSISFLNQDLLSYQTTDSIRSVAMAAFAEAVAVQKKIDTVLRQMETDYSDDLVDRLATLQEAFEQLGGYEIQAKTEAVLEGMGFATQDLDRPLNEFSGGWRMRVMLAKLLLQKPSLLLLDEPTNHLDITAIQWVERYLQSYDRAFVVVSHDRSFLDQVTNKTVEVAQQQLHAYAGNYTFYEKEKATRAVLQQNAYANQQQKIKQTEQFIARFRSKATKAKQVQSRIKALERMDKVEEIMDTTPKLKFNFQLQQQPGKVIASLTHVDKAFGALNILKDASASIERGDKIALIGANGRGKSTLLRLIAGQEVLDAGESSLGHNVSMAFFAQHQLEALHLDHDILEELRLVGAQRTETELRSIAGMFLFTQEAVFKKISVLSGGEKSRVALAKVLLSAANFLLLDEPTNHLDMLSIDILAQTLQQYQGTCVLVSHDRHFVTQVATKIWYLEDYQIKEYPGTYEEYVYWQQHVATP